jgi:hypothetical protein
MTDAGDAAFHAGERGLRPPSRTVPKGGKAGHKAKGRRKRNSDQLLEQPIANSSGAVPCRICGHPVDPKRLHFHMVRFHGAALHPQHP